VNLNGSEFFPASRRYESIETRSLYGFGHAVNDGHGNTVITYDASDTVTLQGVALASLHASDFLFV